MKKNKKQTFDKGNKTAIEILEEVKVQYADYLKINNYFSLPVSKKKEVQYEPPSDKHPLNTHTIKINKK